MGRRCPRRFTILPGEGVRISWACGATKVVADETAVDLEYLADHLDDVNHHHKHRHHKE